MPNLNILSLLLCAWLALPAVAVAQKFHFCSNYEADGTPIGEDSEWLVPADGGNVYIIFKGHKDLAEGTKLTFTMKNKAGERIDSIPITYSAEDGFVVIDYFFEQAGNFSVFMKNDVNKVITAGEVIIELEGDEASAASAMKFADAQVGFAERVVANEAQNVAQVFAIGRDGASLQVFVANEEPFGTDQLVVDVWAREGNAFSRHVETLTLSISTDAIFVYFPYRLREPGLYRFSFFTRGEVFIQNGHVKAVLD